MFAIIQTGGKQYTVRTGDTLTVEKLESAAGDKITLKEVLAVGEGSTLKVGAPTLAGYAVEAEVVKQTRGEKILIIKKRRRKKYDRKNGHRQNLTVLKINAIKTAA